jgi:hypothetical protein
MTTRHRSRRLPAKIDRQMTLDASTLAREDSAGKYYWGMQIEVPVIVALYRCIVGRSEAETRPLIQALPIACRTFSTIMLESTGFSRYASAPFASTIASSRDVG